MHSDRAAVIFVAGLIVVGGALLTFVLPALDDRPVDLDDTVRFGSLAVLMFIVAFAVPGGGAAPGPPDPATYHRRAGVMLGASAALASVAMVGHVLGGDLGDAVIPTAPSFAGGALVASLVLERRSRRTARTSDEPR